MAILIKTENGDYTNKDAIRNTIRYITRTRSNEDRRHELVVYGSPNVSIYDENGVSKAINEFAAVQRYYHGFYLKGSKVYHEVLRLSDEESARFPQNTVLIDGYALQCARVYASLGFQVVYAVHVSAEKELHIHFICNSVSYMDGLKWHFSIADQKKREAYFNQLLNGFINSCNWQYPSPTVFC